MRNALLVFLTTLAIVSAGCRRTDFREHTFSIPGMTAANTNEIIKALAIYDGVIKDSLKFDLEKRTLFVKFDSMKVAQTNIRMAIKDRGIEVSFPQKKNAVAGYLNERDTEVK